MIVDVHYHPITEDWISGRLFDMITNLLLLDASRHGQSVSFQEVRQKIVTQLSDPTGEKLLQHMEDVGIDKIIIVALDFGLALGEARVPITEQNKAIANLAQKYPDRLIAFAGIDPRREGARDILSRCVEEWGMKGLKMHPDFGYYPNSAEAYRLLEKIQEYKLTILTHTGPLPPPSRAKYTQPIYLQDILADFPDIKIIAAHSGMLCWWPEWAIIAAQNPNFYGDLAEWQFMAFNRYEKFCSTLRDMLDTAGPGKLFFGSDSPIFDPVLPCKKWLQLLKDLPEKAPPGIEFKREEIEGILGNNAQQALGL
jgi:hypothetical protein